MCEVHRLAFHACLFPRLPVLQFGAAFSSPPTHTLRRGLGVRRTHGEKRPRRRCSAAAATARSPTSSPRRRRLKLSAPAPQRYHPHPQNLQAEELAARRSG